ncbi:hypothetical protein SAMN05421780_105231 [Flexibacter flexilis DSM 6793]|uniref:ApeA N-terminal domain-containing protein n=1 Tax=Flexibacter flexilis DSM 6793 TaxID=927664 RepID=A0A1I1JEI7_9BACT|nr:hypothetical protein [Flexibacter flexilis]SFC44383.1 hypothetical protein SAMN05421780_105231 [Flexibacter flexilis DSM 6793]
MSDFYCLDVEFDNVDFDNYSYYPHKRVKISVVHHAHLYIEQNEIELRILFDEETYFDEAFMNWSNKINWNKFGSFLKVKVTNSKINERLQKVNLSESKLISVRSHTNFYEQNKKYISVKINTVKFYWPPNEQKKNTAEFYLDDKGFRVIEPFYSFLWPKNEESFNIERMDNSSEFYKLESSEFRPEFNFISNDSRKNRVATITKEPKIQFKYNNIITKEKAIFYGDIVLILISFYHHIKIDYILRRIHLPANTITIKNLEQKNFIDTSGNLREFDIYWDFNEFLQKSWQKGTLQNFELLSKAVNLFNQSHIVDDYSRFLIRYNIIEICDKQKQNNVKFTVILNKNQIKIKQNEALSILLETIKTEEHEEFKKRWNNVQGLLQNKPMKNQLTSFLESQNLDPNTFPIKLNDLKNLRDNITHGSIDKVNAEQLRQANILLYRISGILILNLMGINDWKLNTEIT